MTKINNSLFQKMIEGIYNLSSDEINCVGDIPLIESEDGSFFLDRDPTHFAQILTFINDRENFTIPGDDER